MTNKRYQVAIVGGGPVGVGLAIELGLRGISVAVVEKYPQPQPIPKGQNLTQRTLEHFYFWGIEEELRAARAMPADYPIGGITTYGSLTSGYWYPWLKRELVRPYYFTDNERLPQYGTERVLRKKMATLPTVDSFFGWVGETIEQDKAGVRVTIAERGGDDPQTIEADYLVGCDGSRSVVREAVGIEQAKSDHDKLMVLLVFRSKELHKALEIFPGKSFYCVLHPDLKGYWQFFGRVDVGESWFFHAPVPADTTKDNFDFEALLHRAAGVEFACEFDHIGFWDLRFAVAKTYRQGRVFIAGDAAHSHPPYGGYGINSGLEDARNLGWKLTATLQGWGSEGLLASYSAERQPVFRSTADDFIESFIRTDRVFLDRYNPNQDQAEFEAAWEERQTGASADVHAFEPHYEGSPVVFGPADGVSSARGSHVFAARAGHHLPPQPLSSGQNVFEALGNGFSLLAFDVDDAVVNAFVEAAQALNIPLKIIRDTYSDGREAYESRLILVRPDQFVAWFGDESPGDVSDVFARAIGRG